MSSKAGSTRVVICIFIGLLVIFVWLYFSATKKEGDTYRQAVRASNYKELLLACRTLMLLTITNHPPHPYADTSWSWVIYRTDRDYCHTIPIPIIRLDPKYVAVSQDTVMLLLCAYPKVYMLAFNTNIVGYGAEKVADGLWLSSDPGRDREDFLKGVGNRPQPAPSP